MKVSLALVLVYLAATQICGKRPRKGGKGSQKGKTNTFQGDSYSYTANIGGDVTVNAFAPEGKEGVIVKSYDSALKDQNFTRSTTIYLFNTSSPVFATRVGKSPCFVGDTSLTYAGVISDLQTRNDSTVSISQTETWNATGQPLDKDATKALFESTPGLGGFCGWTKVVQVESATAGASIDETKEFTVLTFDSQATFIVPERSAKPSGGGAGGRRPGRRPDGRPGGRPGSRRGSGGRRGPSGARRGGRRGFRRG